MLPHLPATSCYLIYVSDGVEHSITRLRALDLIGSPVSTTSALPANDESRTPTLPTSTHAASVDSLSHTLVGLGISTVSTVHDAGLMAVNTAGRVVRNVAGASGPVTAEKLVSPDSMVAVYEGHWGADDSRKPAFVKIAIDADGEAKLSQELDFYRRNQNKLRDVLPMLLAAYEDEGTGLKVLVFEPAGQKREVESLDDEEKRIAYDQLVKLHTIGHIMHEDPLNSIFSSNSPPSPALSLSSIASSTGYSIASSLASSIPSSVASFASSATGSSFFSAHGPSSPTSSEPPLPPHIRFVGFGDSTMNHKCPGKECIELTLVRQVFDWVASFEDPAVEAAWKKGERNPAPWEPVDFEWMDD